MDPLILIVEDNLANRKLFRDVLRMTGYTVLEASNGMQGIELAREKRPKLILMDIQMPVMDGIAAAGILKSDPITREIPILALTSYAMRGDKEKILQNGFDGYISKPVHIRLLQKKVVEYLRRGRKKRGPDDHRSLGGEPRRRDEE